MRSRASLGSESASRGCVVSTDGASGFTTLVVLGSTADPSRENAGEWFFLAIDAFRSGNARARRRGRTRRKTLASSNTLARTVCSIRWGRLDFRHSLAIWLFFQD